MSHRIAIVTTKQPGTNPRMRKNADALSAAGHDVHVFYAHTASWADETDRAVFEQVSWRHHRIGGHPKEERWAYTMGRMRRKWASLTGNLRASFNASLGEYVGKLKKLQPDLVIGHNPGALPVLSEWSQYGPVLFDAEDDHPGEFASDSPEHDQVEQLEREELTRLTHITAASPSIGNEYKRRFPHLHVTPIDNAFERSIQPKFQPLEEEQLKLVWFSQVIGLDRGIQEFLQALEPLNDLHIHLSLIGLASESVRKQLLDSLQSPQHTLSFAPPVAEKELLERLGQHHVGLALETGTTRNRQLCRTNKLFCYPLAGCLTLASDTEAQRQFMEEHPEAGVVFSDGEGLRSILQAWHSNPNELDAKRKAAWQLAHDTLHWETESKKLLKLVDSLIKAS